MKYELIQKENTNFLFVPVKDCDDVWRNVRRFRVVVSGDFGIVRHVWDDGQYAATLSGRVLDSLDYNFRHYIKNESFRIILIETGAVIDYNLQSDFGTVDAFIGYLNGVYNDVQFYRDGDYLLVKSSRSFRVEGSLADKLGFDKAVHYVKESLSNVEVIEDVIFELAPENLLYSAEEVEDGIYSVTGLVDLGGETVTFSFKEVAYKQAENVYNKALISQIEADFSEDCMLRLLNYGALLRGVKIAADLGDEGSIKKMFDKLKSLNIEKC